MSITFTPTELKDYLLGKANESQCESIEIHLITSDSFLEVLENTESDLVEDYLDEILNEFDRQQFELFFLRTAERQQLFWLIKNLRKIAKEQIRLEGK